MDSKTIEMAALGRALHPGMLYDCRSDSFIPGVTLWNKAALRKQLDMHRQPKTDVKFSASDSLRDKANLLDVGASLKASFLGGLVQVGGSAKYLCDQKASASQSRITMQYSQTTRFEQLTMTHLGKITYPEVFDDKTATHVITAVLYGAQAFMVFDKTASENEDMKKMEGTLRAIVKKIPSFSIEGKGALKLNDEEKNVAENINCTFYGDYEIEENPTTYMEALQLYKKLPTLLRQREDDAVPLKVWLYPLACLDDKAAKLERQIGVTLISKIEGALEELADVERRCKDFIKNKTINHFQDVKDRLQTFQGLFADYKVLFQKALRRLLPAIRGGEENEQALADIVHIHETSPFRAKSLRQWLEKVQGEVEWLDSYTSELSSVTSTVTPTDRFNSILSKPTVDTVVCFSFTSLKNEDQFLSSLTPMVDEFKKIPLVAKSYDQDTEVPWFSNHELFKKMKEDVLLFKEFFEANKSIKTTRFVIAAIPDSSNPGTSIRLYRNGKLVDANFQPVSKPPSPSVDILDKSVVLKLQKPPTGVTVQFRVEHRATQPDAAGADAEAWDVRDTPDAQESFTLTGLELARQHWVRYRAVSDVGVSEASDAVPFSLRGMNWTISSLCNDIRAKIMTGLGISRWSLSTIESEVTNRLSNITKSYIGQIAGGLKAGLALFFQGVVPSDANSFTIDLKTKDSDDIPFHFKAQVGTPKVVRNSYQSGWWKRAEETFGGPFVKGGAFDICMFVKPKSYKVIVNGHFFCKFMHCMPLETVSVLNINGDVFINTFSIFEVDKVKMKVTMPAHLKEN
ncbi:verrucotoxin subunit beta-like [Salminus brasiliensis]|uniref:verrucotoxin subunit beta-like n=1 Tax=Salminus brasiliensis TaxID=930266 RepID=UPI003B839293